jgi:hypothetical protein
MFEQWTDEIGRSALRDEQKWGPAYRDTWGARSDLTTYLEETSYIRTWLQERWNYLDASL